MEGSGSQINITVILEKVLKSKYSQRLGYSSVMRYCLQASHAGLEGPFCFDNWCKVSVSWFNVSHSINHYSVAVMNCNKLYSRTIA